MQVQVQLQVKRALMSRQLISRAPLRLLFFCFNRQQTVELVELLQHIRFDGLGGHYLAANPVPHERKLSET